MLHLRLTADNPAEYQDDNALIGRRLVTAMLHGWLNNESNIFCDTLSDNDRGYFPRSGVLDRRFNPKHGYHVVKNLHGVLSSLGKAISIEKVSVTADIQATKVVADQGSICFVGEYPKNRTTISAMASAAPKNSLWIQWQQAALSDRIQQSGSDYPIAFVQYN